MALGKVVKGSVWLYGASLINNLFGALYWFVISAVGGPEILGITSAVIGFSGLISGLVNFGVGVGVLKFVGKYFGERDLEDVSSYFWTSLIFLLFTVTAAGSFLFMAGFLGFNFSGLTNEMLILAGVIVCLTFSGLFNTFLTALVKTDIIFKSNLIANIAKLIIGLGLVVAGCGWIGAVLGYTAISIVNGIILGSSVFKIVGFKPSFSLLRLRNLLKAGLVSWIPGLITLAGQWLGVLAIFGSSGAFETGLYYVAFSIANVVLMTATSLSTVLLPVLSSMSDGRKRAAWRVARVGLALAWPLAVFIAVYPWLPLSVLGRSFTGASTILDILILSLIFTVLTSSVVNLAYAYDLYGYVLAIGLAANIPRVALYYFLVPIYGGLGAATSFSFGAFIGFLVALAIAGKIGFRINFRDLFLIVVMPVSLGVFSYMFNLHFLIGGVLIYIPSIIFYIKVGVLLKRDIREVVFNIFPPGFLSLLRDLIIRFKSG